MDKDFFMRVWSIYWDHWGLENSYANHRKQAADTLENKIHSSSSMKALLFFLSLTTKMDGLGGTGFFYNLDEIMNTIRDLTECCLGENMMFPSYWKRPTEMDYYEYNVHAIVAL